MKKVFEFIELAWITFLEILDERKRSKSEKNGW
jgi:hypothetical protein